MKGSLHTDELMREVTSSTNGLRTARRISHVVIMDVPTYPGGPRVAILSAVETVTSKIPSTIDVAALCKMADRGQIV